MGKYGKRNHVKVNPLTYNVMLIGEPGIGKTTIIKEYCEKLAGPEGYLFLEIGKEDGADAIEDIVSIHCPDWDSEYTMDADGTEHIGFETIIDDIVQNKSTDWPDLKLVVIDTCDELFAISEPEVIRMHNADNPNKRVKSIKAAFGGFQGGEDKTIEIVLDKLWSLKSVGVRFIIIGHTKERNVTDPITGMDYRQITTNMSQKYFNAIKNKVHFLGVAAIDREIVREKTGKKDMVTHQDIIKGVVKSEARKITFRDDNFVIDSKSRFADIVESIPMNSDALIQAITDAIKAEQAKSGKTLEETKAEQDADEVKRLKEIAEKEKAKKAEKQLNTVISQITNYIKANKSDMEVIKPIIKLTKELGYDNPTMISDITDANKVLALIS